MPISDGPFNHQQATIHNGRFTDMFGRFEASTNQKSRMAFLPFQKGKSGDCFGLWWWRMHVRILRNFG